MTPLTGDPASHSTSDLNENGMTGSCNCGAITITLKQKDLFTKPNGHICHCSNCRKFTGTAGAHILRTQASNVEVSDPKGLKKTYFDSNSGTGGTVPRSFCTECGTSLGAVGIPGADQAFVFLGIFPRIPVPAEELFTKHRQEWVVPIEGAAQYEFLWT